MFHIPLRLFSPTEVFRFTFPEHPFANGEENSFVVMFIQMLVAKSEQTLSNDHIIRFVGLQNMLIIFDQVDL